MNRPYWTTPRPKPQQNMKAEYGMSVELSPSNWRKANLILDGKNGETAEQLLDRTANTVEQWFNKRHATQTMYEQPHNPYPTTVVPTEKPIPEEQRVAILLADILACTELPKPKGLLSYENLVKSANKPDITAAYNLMLKKLSQ